VLVFEDGKLVDDTQRQATQEKEATLREQALQELAARKEAERNKAQQAAQSDTGDEAAAGIAKEDDAIAIFRAIISEWDRRKGKTKAPRGPAPAVGVPTEPPPTAP
jgi:hypothetical protein